MREYTVEFRIYGKDLDPAAITSELGLEPSEVRVTGEQRAQTTAWKEGMWSYNGQPASLGSKEWASLEEGITFILERLRPVMLKIDHYKARHRLILWCGCFQSDFNSSFSLSPSTLSMLAELGIEVFIDIYFSE